ncbi:MAG: choice-of-anchor X domain-containing protein [Myxococcota bacterium]|jgi:hypothetical protein|nr:choice-of-anchor X domain-containing protein [Myxococcota bacterium]
MVMRAHGYTTGALAIFGLALASCTTEMAIDTLLSADGNAPPAAPENRVLVRVQGLDGPTLALVDSVTGKTLEVAAEPCDLPATGCPEGAPAGSYLFRLPGTESYPNLRVIATQGALALRTLVPDVPRATSVYDAPRLIDAGTIDLQSTASSLLIEGKATASGLGVAGLPAVTTEKAQAEILALRDAGDEAVVRYFATVQRLHDFAASNGSVPVFVSPGYTPGYEPAPGGSSALNPAFIAANPFDYDQDEARAWVCREGAAAGCPSSVSCNEGQVIQYQCPGVRARAANGTLSNFRLDWCTCEGGNWVCRDGVEDQCPTAIAHGTVREHLCSGAPGGSTAKAFVPECTFSSFCVKVVECALGCTGDDQAACLERCHDPSIPQLRRDEADDLLACLARTGCDEEDAPLTCAAQDGNCPELLRFCRGGEIVCATGAAEPCDCPGNREGTRACRADRLGWEECDCEEGPPALSAPAAPRGEWFCLDRPQVACVDPQGACDGSTATLPFVCPALTPGLAKADYQTMPWCDCSLQPNEDTVAFDAILRDAAQRFGFSQICFADTDRTTDSACFLAADCWAGCGDDAACAAACADEVPAARQPDLDALTGCLTANDCLTGSDWRTCAQQRCRDLLDGCLDWDGNDDTCWGGRCTIRAVFSTDFREGKKDGCCATLNRFKWTKPGSGPMHFTGGIHKSDTLPLSDAERNEINQQLGNWVPNLVRMYDDGTNGDLVAADGIWTIVFELPIGLHMSYKYTYGPDGNIWTGTEEWPGNAHILEIRDVNADHFITRHDNYGDECTNKDVANGNPRVANTLEWDEDANGDGLFDVHERPYDLDNDCTLDDWKLLSTATPKTIPCPSE